MIVKDAKGNELLLMNNLAHMGNNFQYMIDTLCFRKYND